MDFGFTLKDKVRMLPLQLVQHAPSINQFLQWLPITPPSKQSDKAES